MIGDPGILVHMPLAKASYVSIWVWGGVLIGVALGALFIMLAIRKRMMDRSSGIDQPFTLQNLRELRANRQISETEFQTLRAQMIASAKADESVTNDEL